MTIGTVLNHLYQTTIFPEKKKKNYLGTQLKPRAYLLFLSFHTPEATPLSSLYPNFVLICTLNL